MTTDELQAHRDSGTARRPPIQVTLEEIEAGTILESAANIREALQQRDD